MVEARRPVQVKQVPALQGMARQKPALQKRSIPVKKAMDEALKLYNAGKLESAAHLCAQIAAARPRLASANNLLGVILNALGKQKEAVKALQRAANLEPRNAQYLSNLGEIERLRGKLPEALAWLTQAISVNPKLSQAHNN